jgi:hypothetical protein
MDAGGEGARGGLELGCFTLRTCTLIKKKKDLMCAVCHTVCVRGGGHCTIV